MDPALEELVDTGEAVDEVTVLVKLRDPARPPAGIRIVAQLGPIATARVQRLAIRQVWEDPSVLSLKAPRWYTHEYGPIIDPIDRTMPPDRITKVVPMAAMMILMFIVIVYLADRLMPPAAYVWVSLRCTRHAAVTKLCLMDLSLCQFYAASGRLIRRRAAARNSRRVVGL